MKSSERIVPGGKEHRTVSRVATVVDSAAAGLSGGSLREVVPGSKEHRTVSRVAAILESAAAAPNGVSLKDVAGRLSAPKSSVHGLLRGLVAVGYLVERNGRYVMSAGLPALLMAAHVPSLEDLARPAMTRLRDTFEESVMLGVQTGDTVVYVDSVESRQPVKYSAPLHERRLLHPSSMGKLYLAELPADRLNAYIRANHLAPRAGRRLREELDEVRTQRVGYNREETFAGVTAVAAGIRDSEQSLVACISIAGPTFRMAGNLATIADEIRAAAESISADFIRYENGRGRTPGRPATTGLIGQTPGMMGETPGA